MPHRLQLEEKRKKKKEKKLNKFQRDA